MEIVPSPHRSQFLSSSFQCLEDKQACGERYGSLDCELIMIVCLLERVRAVQLGACAGRSSPRSSEGRARASPHSYLQANHTRQPALRNSRLATGTTAGHCRQP